MFLEPLQNRKNQQTNKKNKKTPTPLAYTVYLLIFEIICREVGEKILKMAANTERDTEAVERIVKTKGI